MTNVMCYVFRRYVSHYGATATASCSSPRATRTGTGAGSRTASPVPVPPSTAPAAATAANHGHDSSAAATDDAAGGAVPRYVARCGGWCGHFNRTQRPTGTLKHVILLFLPPFHKLRRPVSLFHKPSAMFFSLSLFCSLTPRPS